MGSYCGGCSHTLSTAAGEASQGAEGTVRTAESQELLPRGHLMFHADYEGGNMERYCS